MLPKGLQCGKCQKKCKRNDYLTCSICKEILCIDDCSNVSRQRYIIMEISKRAKWRCMKCIKKSSTPLAMKHQKEAKTQRDIPIVQPGKSVDCMGTSIASSEITDPTTNNESTETKPDDSLHTLQLSVIQTKSSPDGFDFITERKKEVRVNVPIKNSFESLSYSIESDSEDENSSSMVNDKSDVLGRSCPELNTMIINNELVELREKVSVLESQLISAENEIGNVLAENFHLKEEISKYKIKFEQLTRLCLTTNTNTAKKKKKKQRKPNKTLPTLCSKRDSSASELSINQPSNLVKDVNSDVHEPVIMPPNENTKPEKGIQMTSVDDKKERKICVISNTLQIGELIAAQKETFRGKICHYKKPGCGIEQLLQGLGNKVKDFTLNDYCIIFIGPSDFEVTNNYQQLVDIIRSELQKIQHTNIILCVPTFKYSGPCDMFNWRVESFNNYLFKDNNTHEYAFILDSNKNLEYSHAMFSIYSGKINKNGMKQIFKDLNDVIEKIYLYHRDFNVPVKDTEVQRSVETDSITDQFFRE